MLNILMTFLAMPAVQSAIIMGAMSLYGYITKKNAEADRWQSIGEIALQVVVDLYNKGLKDWQEVAAEAMRQIVAEIAAHPGMKSLTPEETGKLAPYVLKLAQRKNGVLPSAAPHN